MKHNKNSVVVENFISTIKITNLTPQTWVIKPICKANRIQTKCKQLKNNIKYNSKQAKEIRIWGG